MADDKDLATEGTEDRVEGAGNKIGGRLRNAVGGATGDSSEQVKGKAQEIKGKVQDAVGKAKQRADRDPGVEED
ncbi:MAG TPA: CsbD family protein [Gemmatimonadales bacterium]|nr:CsbD family protein [Gemmatimonadales bacterium]